MLSSCVACVALLATASVPSPSPSQAEAIANLRRQIGNDVVYRMNASGSVRYLAARDIAPGCRAAIISDKAGAENFIRCFLSMHDPLWKEDREDTRAAPWRVKHISPMSADGYQIIRVEQLYEDLRVDGSELVFAVRNGVLRSVLGRFFPPSRIQSLLGRATSLTTVEEVEAASHERLRLLERYFDPGIGAVVSEFVLLDDERRHLLWDEDAGAELRRFSVARRSVQQRDTAVAKYDIFWIKAGNPQTRSIGVDISTSGSICSAKLDHGTALEDGEPKLCRGFGGENNCNALASDPTVQNFVGSCPSSVFEGYQPSSGTELGMQMNAYFWIHDLSTFANHWWSTYDGWYDWASFGDPENLKVVVTEEMAACEDEEEASNDTRACTFLGSSEHRIVLIRGLSDSALDIMAHEYGHFIHNMYGWGPENNLASNAVSEGFADQNVLRYALFRSKETANRPHDSGLPSIIPYGEDVSGCCMSEHRLQDTIGDIPYYNGEAVPGPEETALPGVDYSHLTYEPWKANTACNPSGGEAHRCGALIPAVYWTLANNKLKVGYGGRAAGCDILHNSGGAYLSDPARPANISFTYAMVSVPSDTSLEDYFVRVSERYYDFMVDGWITSEERHRIEQAMAVHCVGWSGAKCTSEAFHKTAWQTRPAIDTWKANFQGVSSGCGLAAYGQQEHFIRAEEMIARGAQPALKTSLSTSGDSLRYVYMYATGQTLCAFVHFPWTGNYSFHAAVRPYNSSSDSFQVGVNGPNGTFHNWQVEPWYGGWIWSHAGPILSVTSGSHEVCVKRAAENMDIDALLIRRE